MGSKRFNIQKVSADAEIAKQRDGVIYITPNFKRRLSSSKDKSSGMGDFIMTPQKRILIRKLVAQMKGVTIDEATSKAITKVMKGEKTTI